MTADNRPKVPGYEVGAQLGSGGYGTVWSARSTADGADVAIKTLHGDGKRVDPDAAERFERELMVLSAITSEHVVRVRAAGPLRRGGLYIVMDRVPGEPLRALLGRDAPLPWRAVLAILAEVAQGLADVHAVGVVHRDLKPENVMVWRDAHRWRAMILDFGIVKAVESALPWRDLTADDKRIGTPRYMAPEYLFRGVAGPRGDLFALGVIAYELLGGPLKAPSDPVAIARAKGQPLPPLSERSGGRVPPQVCALVDRLVHPDPDVRPAGAGLLVAILADLGHALRDVPDGGPPAKGAPAPTMMLATPRPAAVAGTTLLGSPEAEDQIDQGLALPTMPMELATPPAPPAEASPPPSTRRPRRPRKRRGSSPRGGFTLLEKVQFAVAGAAVLIVVLVLSGVL